MRILTTLGVLFVVELLSIRHCTSGYASPEALPAQRHLANDTVHPEPLRQQDEHRVARDECLVSIREDQPAGLAAFGTVNSPADVLATAGAVSVEAVFRAPSVPVSSSDLASLASSQKDTIYRVRFQSASSATASHTADLSAVTEQCQVFMSLPGVTAVQPNFIYSANLLPNDPLIQYSHKDAFISTHAHAAWDITTGSPEIIVAVLDSGVNAHTELAGRILSGYDFVNGDNDTSDDNGHGTHVAGVVAARGNNGVGAAGVAWNSRILPVKVLDNIARGSTANIIAGIQYAVDNGARILNLSLGQIDPDPALQAALQYALANGSLPIAAVGNDGRDAKRYPAAYPEALAVSSHWDGFAYAGFSNFGPWVDLSAPGLRLVTLKNDGTGFTEQSGTSISAPFVSGAAALVLSVEPQLTPRQLRARLLATAYGDLYSNPATREHRYNKRFGAGSIDLAAAVTDTSERTSIAKITVLQSGSIVSEALLQRSTQYDLEVEVENVAPSDRTATIEVLSNDAHLTIGGGGARSRLLATGVPVQETGYNLRIAADATPNTELSLRVRITPASGPAEDHTFVITPTFNYAAGWPQTIPVCNAGAPAARPAFVTQVGADVVIYQANWTGSTLHTFRADGATRYATLNTSEVLYTPLTANLSAETPDDIVFPVASTEAGAWVEAVTSTNHAPLTDWPVAQQGFQSGLTGFSIEAGERITAADLDRDGFDELIIAENRFFKQISPVAAGGPYQTRVYALRRDGSVMPGWPQLITGQISSLASPAVGDMTGDGNLEIIIPIQSESMETSTSAPFTPPPPVLVFSANGALVKTLTPSVGLAPRCGYASEGVAVADFDDDGKIEIVRDYGGCGLQVWRGDGSQLPGFPSLGGRSFSDLPAGLSSRALGAGPSIADINGDGSLDIAVSAAGFRTTGSWIGDPVDYATTLVIVGSNGVSLPGFPKLLEVIPYPDQFWALKFGPQPLLVDIDGNGTREVFAQSRVEGTLFGFTSQGEHVAGFPMRFRTAGAASTSFSFADIDLDGTFELISAADLRDALTIYDLPFRYAEATNQAVDPSYAPWPRQSADLKLTNRSPDQPSSYLAGTPVATPTPTSSPSPVSTATPTRTATATATATSTSAHMTTATPTATSTQIPTVISPTATTTPSVTTSPTPTVTETPTSAAQLKFSVKQVRGGKISTAVRFKISARSVFRRSTISTRVVVQYTCSLGRQERTGGFSTSLGEEKTITLRRMLNAMQCVFSASHDQLGTAAQRVTVRTRSAP